MILPGHNTFRVTLNGEVKNADLYWVDVEDSKVSFKYQDGMTNDLIDSDGY